MLSPDADGKMAKAGLIKSRAEDMKRSRQKRRDAGLVEYRVWVTPAQRDALQYALRQCIEPEWDAAVEKARAIYAPLSKGLPDAEK